MIRRVEGVLATGRRWLFARPMLFRVIRVHDRPTYHGWCWLDGYELTAADDAMTRRSIFVKVDGLQRAHTGPPLNQYRSARTPVNQRRAETENGLPSGPGHGHIPGGPKDNLPPAADHSAQPLRRAHWAPRWFCCSAASPDPMVRPRSATGRLQAPALQPPAPCRRGAGHTSQDAGPPARWRSTPRTALAGCPGSSTVPQVALDVAVVLDRRPVCGRSGQGCS